MFIAHLPAGYIVSHLLTCHHPNRRHLICAGLIGAVLPDADLLWFYLIGDRQVGHHAYPTHWPSLWGAVVAGAWLVSFRFGGKALRDHVTVVGACLMAHMFLDSFAAPIFWLQPFRDTPFNLIEVPARHDWWVWNFVLHWSFAVELAICGFAAVLYLRNRRYSPRDNQLLRYDPGELP